MVNELEPTLRNLIPVGAAGGRTSISNADGDDVAEPA